MNEENKHLGTASIGFDGGNAKYFFISIPKYSDSFNIYRDKKKKELFLNHFLERIFINCFFSHTKIILFFCGR